MLRISMNEQYEQCLKQAASSKRKLCPRGYCTAKHKFKVYPSAYANGYAVQVCNGKKPDYRGKYERDSQKSPVEQSKPSGLKRWFEEEWVNVCERGDGPGGFKRCGRSNATLNRLNYPYCRPYNRTSNTKLVTAQDLTSSEIKMMCNEKRALKQGERGKPTRVIIPKRIRKRVKQQTGGGNGYRTIQIPRSVQQAAKLGLKLRNNGFTGGTQTGWNRAKQLTGKLIDLKSLADMRTWFARHGPDAKNGGTSYQGYLKWLRMGKPSAKTTSSGQKRQFRGAVSWLIWGGDPAYLWLKQHNIQQQLVKAFPKRKQASATNNLVQNV